MTTKTYKLPPKFYEDHRARDCGETGIVLRETKTYFLVELDQAAFDDLRSDCVYYVQTGGMGGFDEGLGGLVASAKATLKRLDADPLGPVPTRWTCVNASGGVFNVVAPTAADAFVQATVTFPNHEWTIKEGA